MTADQPITLSPAESERIEEALNLAYGRIASALRPTEPTTRELPPRRELTDPTLTAIRAALEILKREGAST